MKSTIQAGQMSTIAQLLRVQISLLKENNELLGKLIIKEAIEAAEGNKDE